jgi:hypothetical protein
MPIPLFLVAGLAVGKTAAWIAGATAVTAAGAFAVNTYNNSQEASDAEYTRKASEQEAQAAREQACANALHEEACQQLTCLLKQHGVNAVEAGIDVQAVVSLMLEPSEKTPADLTFTVPTLPKNKFLLEESATLMAEMQALSACREKLKAL